MHVSPSRIKFDTCSESIETTVSISEHINLDRILLKQSILSHMPDYNIETYDLHQFFFSLNKPSRLHQKPVIPHEAAHENAQKII
jgi:hypothetical protein